MEIHSFTREQLAIMYGWHPKTLKKKLFAEGLIIPPGAITPRMINLIFDKLGNPPFYRKCMEVWFNK